MKAPIRELMDEHVVILRMLAVLRGMCRRLSAGERVEPGDLDAVLEFVESFADRSHHGKEEDLLFPAMMSAGFPKDAGPLAVMLMEHSRGRELVAALRRAAARLKEGASGAAREALSAALGYADLLAHHIDKEDNVLYPMALRVVPEPHWERLALSFARVEEELMGPGRRAGYETLLARLEGEYLAAA